MRLIKDLPSIEREAWLKIEMIQSSPITVDELAFYQQWEFCNRPLLAKTFGEQSANDLAILEKVDKLISLAKTISKYRLKDEVESEIMTQGYEQLKAQLKQ